MIEIRTKNKKKKTLKDKSNQIKQILISNSNSSNETQVTISDIKSLSIQSHVIDPLQQKIGSKI